MLHGRPIVARALRSSPLSLSRWSKTVHSCDRQLSTTSQHGKVILSGIQPTGIPHLGNYLGALRQWKKLQDEAGPDDKLFFAIVDLHAVTTMMRDPDRLRSRRKQMFASLLAMGLDPTKSVIFYQSQVPAHSELMWLLSCLSSMGNLGRMTQWKAKTTIQLDDGTVQRVQEFSETDSVRRLGLYTYPVLQAADILLHGATHVPVGADQMQHLEFTRTIANEFNNLYGPILTIPETLVTQSARVLSLRDASSKMSKSSPTPKDWVGFLDEREVIHAKIRGAITDSNKQDEITYDPQRRPGLANLIEILFHLSGSTYASIDDAVADVRLMKIGAFKSKVADAIDAELHPIRERFRAMDVSNSSLPQLDAAAEKGRQAAQVSAEATMHKVRMAMGLAGGKTEAREMRALRETRAAVSTAND